MSFGIDERAVIQVYNQIIAVPVALCFSNGNCVSPHMAHRSDELRTNCVIFLETNTSLLFFANCTLSFVIINYFILFKINLHNLH